jgi:GT2 family glycosyltransferase
MTSSPPPDGAVAPAPEVSPAADGGDGVDCALVVVTYRSAGHLDLLLGSLPAAAGPLRLHTTVVDNDSRDQVGDVAAAYPDVRLIRSRNLGYAGAINLALPRLPASRWVLVLNPDVVLEPGSLGALIDAAERWRASAAVPLMVSGSGERAHSLRREPSLSRAAGEAVLGDHFPRRPSWLAEVVRDAGAYDVEHAVDWATGAVVLLSSCAVAQLGNWDDSYFLYSEETDYLRRLRAGGGQVVFTPAAVARHEGGGSGVSPALVALAAVNRVRYFGRWHGGAATAVFWCIALLHALLRVARPEERVAAGALVRRRARSRLPGRCPDVAVSG